MPQAILLNLNIDFEEALLAPAFSVIFAIFTA